MKQPKSTADKALPALLIAFFAGTSGAFADELLDAPSSQGNYLLFPAEVQQERIDLQKTDRWRDMKPAQRRAALKEIDKNFLERNTPVKPANDSAAAPIAPKEQRSPEGVALGEVETRDWGVVTTPQHRRTGASLVLRGTVRPGEVVMLRAPVDGKLERAPSPVHVWVSRRKPVMSVLPAELAAILSSPQTTPTEEILSRWKDMFRPTPIRCPKDCMVLSYRIQPGGSVHQGDVVAQAATSLILEAEVDSRVAPEPEAWRSSKIVFWLLTDPAVRWETSVTDALDNRLFCRLPSGLNLPPGAKWEGRLKTFAATQNSWTSRNETE